MVVLSVINLSPYRKISLPNIGPFRVNETFTHSLEIDPKSLLNEGVFGIEMFATKEKTKIQLFSSEPGNRYQAPVLLSREKQDVKQVQTFYIAGSKPSIYSFAFQANKNLWVGLKEVIAATIQDQKVFIQVLAESQDISERMEKDHELYMKGVNSPSSFFPVRKFQEKFVEWSDNHNFLQSQNKEIPELQRKMSEEGYKCTIKLAIYGGKDNKRLVKSILSVFRGLNGRNSWESFEVSLGKKAFLDGMQLRKFPLVGKPQYLCHSELLPILDVKPDLQESRVIEPLIERPKSSSSSRLPSLNLLPSGARKEKVIDIPSQQQEIQTAFKKVGIPCVGMRITKIQSGATVKKITMQIPTDMKFSKIKNLKEDIQAELGWKGMAIEQGEEAGTMAITVPKEREKVFLRDLIDTDEFKEFAQKNALPFVVGENVIGEPQMFNLAKMPHLLVVGSTGSGKSVFVVSLILTILIYKTPYQVRFILVDPKMVEFPIFKEFPHVADVVTDAPNAVLTLKKLGMEMEKRYEKFAEVGVKNIEQYNAKESKKMDYIVCVIDELADLMLIAKGEVEDSLQHLAQLARASGIHLIVATQRPSVDVITGTIKNNFPSRIVMTLSSDADYKTVLNKKPPFTLLGFGDGVASINGSDQYIRFQGPLVAESEETTDEVIHRICDEWNGVQVEKYLPEIQEDEEEPQIELTPVEKAKLFICQTKDTRLRSVQKHLEIRMEAVKEIYGELVQEGWLQSPEKARDGYKLILPEEEIEEFLNQYQ